jgi:hypothetical protein
LLVIALAAPVISAAPTDKDVRVINTTAEPVPTAAQGTTTIAGSVSVTNTPNVNVGNSASAPIPIVDMNDGRQPFQASTFVVHPNGTNVDTMNVATIPAGKRLVIEFISVSAQVPPGQHLELATVQTLAGGHGAAHQLLIQAQPDAVIGDDIYRAVQELRLYADPGSTVQVLVRRNSGLGQATFGVTISGYFVNL